MLKEAHKPLQCRGVTKRLSQGAMGRNRHPPDPSSPRLCRAGTSSLIRKEGGWCRLSIVHFFLPGFYQTKEQPVESNISLLVFVFFIKSLSGQLHAPAIGVRTQRAGVSIPSEPALLPASCLRNQFSVPAGSGCCEN